MRRARKLAYGIAAIVGTLIAGCCEALRRDGAFALSPGGKLVIDERDGELAHPAARRIAAAFAIGSGAGLLHLATTELAAELSASLAFGRELGALWLTRVCGLPDEARAQADVPVSDEDLRALLARAPPMRGSEQLSLEALAGAWFSMQAHVAGSPSFLRELGPPWHVVGRVCFHLAENKADPSAPFAFLATYAAGVGVGGRAQQGKSARVTSTLAAPTPTIVP